MAPHNCVAFSRSPAGAVRRARPRHRLPTDADAQASIAAVRAEFEGKPGITIDTLDGMTVESQDWWFNLRPSNTEPLLRLNVEAEDPQQMQDVRDEVLAMIKALG